MDKTRIIIIFIISLMIHQTLPSPFFRTSTTDSSHITDFRLQAKSDSRADKPDLFPGFDFFDDPTTQRPISRRDIYVEIIGTVLRNVRSRITNAFENLSQLQQQQKPQQQQDEEKPIHSRKRNEFEAINKNTKNKDVLLETNKTSEENLMKSANLKLINDDDDVDESTEFIGLTLDEDIDGVNIGFDSTITENNNNPDYFSLILRAFGLNKNHYNKTNLIGQNLENKMKIISTYILTPIIDVWNKKINETKLLNSSDEMIPKNAQLIFQNAFLKSSKLMMNTNLNINDLTKLPSGHENVNDDDDDEDEDDEEENYNEDEEKGRNMDSLAIPILEFFGNIIGLAWGAFTQLQNVFMKN